MVVTDNKMKMKMSIKEAITSALADYEANGRLTLPNPAIVRLQCEAVRIIMEP